jgi:hypothetical protein
MANQVPIPEPGDQTEIADYVATISGGLAMMARLEAENINRGVSQTKGGH